MRDSPPVGLAGAGRFVEIIMCFQVIRTGVLESEHEVLTREDAERRALSTSKSYPPTAAAAAGKMSWWTCWTPSAPCWKWTQSVYILANGGDVGAQVKGMKNWPQRCWGSWPLCTTGVPRGTRRGLRQGRSQPGCR
jgi:hypothetical protein